MISFSGKTPRNICILRLSAIGDICHALPVVRTLQHHWPQTHITWVIGKLEHSLIGDIPGIEFIIFDKAGGFSAYRQLRRQMRGRRFEVLLHMQMSLRASLASLLIPTDIRLGFDRGRAKDFQWLFTNQKIAPHKNQHVLESLFGFTEALGIDERLLKWDIPLSEEIRQQADKLVGDDNPYLVISPCSSMAYRNWNVEGYAAVANYAVEKYGLRVVLCGGPTQLEQEYGRDISALCRLPPINLIGQTSLKQLLAILDKAHLLIAPDSGPAHMATTVNTPVIGLYAATNPDRARPYNSKAYVVNKYPQAVKAAYGKMPAELPWGIRVREAGVMERITAEDVKRMLDNLMQTNPL